MKITEILTKPVINLYDSKIEGIVKNVIFDNNFKKIKWFSIFDNNEIQEEKVLSSKNIFSFGENAITIKNGSVLNLEYSNIKINEKPFPIYNKVYTTSGKYLGELKDIEVDEKYYITNLIVDDKKISINKIFNCGKDAIIIQDENNIIKKCNLVCKKKNNNNVKILTENIDEQQKVVALSETANLENITNSVSTNEQKNKNVKVKYSPEKINIKQHIVPTNINFLLGRKIERNIYSQNNELIARKNTKITEDTLKKATQYVKVRELIKFSK